MSIKLIVLDVDGTMTNGQITYTQNGDELKSFNVKDGLAIVSWIKLGNYVAIITGRNSDIVARRAKELGVKYFYQNIKDKDIVLKTLLDKLNLTMENVAAIGDDLNDYKMLKEVEISFVPNDATIYLEREVDVILSKNGGDGAVREMIEYLIKKEALEQEYLNLWIK